MSETTKIEWCDSALNIMAGCDGCELWNRKTGTLHCYAGTLTDRYSGRKGWPESFEKPTLFLERLDKALRWRDLTGTGRPDKPWLDSLPRMVFLNDMGDTFTESLPLDWLAPLLPRLADAPHVWMLLTKRPKRMREFSEKHPLPPNVWPGTSVTTQATASRVGELLGVQGGGIRWVSAEPLLEQVGLQRWLADRTDMVPQQGVGLVIIGGESGPGARPCRLEWIRSLLAQCRGAEVPAFCKQLGSLPELDNDTLLLRDHKGGNPAEWPADLRVREFPR